MAQRGRSERDDGGGGEKGGPSKEPRKKGTGNKNESGKSPGKNPGGNAEISPLMMGRKGDSGNQERGENKRERITGCFLFNARPGATKSKKGANKRAGEEEDTGAHPEGGPPKNPGARGREGEGGKGAPEGGGKNFFGFF